ncbi:MAG: hypothetical protein FWG34_14960 [Oscillospiraceae bacterium]|nr:hypothetical protein [Oscillospiraceae bacterium]
MHEIETLKKFLNFPISSTAKIYDEFKNIDGHVFREEDTNGKERFLYIEGRLENKVLLVAHADTYYDVCWDYPPKKHIVLHDGDFIKAVDKKGAPQLLGADDRAGVAMLWLLKDSGHSLLITDGEEHGQKGSEWLIKNNRDIAEKINFNHQFMIQLDRKNKNDFKCYQVGTDEFRAFVKNKTGYKEPDKSSSTDICVLCKNICGVNFSVGYYNEHGCDEKLNVREWLNTYCMVKELLAENDLPKFLLHENFDII